MRLHGSSRLGIEAIASKSASKSTTRSASTGVNPLFHGRFSPSISFNPRRFFSDHYSPMFPMRPSPPTHTPTPLQGTSSRQEESWLSKHSGKIGISALISTIFFFYSYYKSGRNRVDEEDALTLVQAVEPYEINEIRFSSQGFTRELFEQVTREAHARFPSGHARYEDYVLFVKKVLHDQNPSCQMGGGHLLDRIVQQHEHFHKTKELPLLFLLTLTNLGMQAPAVDRADTLFSAATTMSSITATTTTTTTTTTAKEEKEEAKDEEKETLSEEQANTIVLHLAQTCQIPSEKQVKETGVQYPFKTFRIKTAQEMVQGFLDEKDKAAQEAAKKANTEQQTKQVQVQQQQQQQQQQQRSLTRQEFRELIVSSYVCAWAECYR